LCCGRIRWRNQEKFCSELDQTSSLAPRFERKAAAEAEQKHIYYEGEFCEAEDLPNGFTKIRNGNLVKIIPFKTLNRTFSKVCKKIKYFTRFFLQV
jgi:hypothetical protein